MPQHIKETTQLQCDKGTIPTPITVTSQTFMSIEGKLKATEEDKQSNVNIKPFGQCKIKPTTGGFLPCIPAPASWQKTTEKDTINNYKILTADSFCMCSMGGRIVVYSKGHGEMHEMK